MINKLLYILPLLLFSCHTERFRLNWQKENIEASNKFDRLNGFKNTKCTNNNFDNYDLICRTENNKGKIIIYRCEDSSCNLTTFDIEDICIIPKIDGGL